MIRNASVPKEPFELEWNYAFSLSLNFKSRRDLGEPHPLNLQM